MKKSKSIFFLYALVFVTGAVFLLCANIVRPVFGKNTQNNICDDGVFAFCDEQDEGFAQSCLFLAEQEAAQQAAFAPWNTQIIFYYDGKKHSYQVDKNLSGLSDEEIQKRQIFCASKSKAKWVENRKKEGIEPLLSLCFLLPNLQGAIQKIQAEVDKPPIDATITFLPNSAKKFSYTEDKHGRQVDIKTLAEKLLARLSEGKTTFSVQVPTSTLRPNLTLAEARNATSQKSYFETPCHYSTQNRLNNIAKALSFFNGKILETGEKVGFNEVVGERTAERGFYTAKILANGQYVDGVGGGVCQASTTLFCALLKADLKILTVCQHSVKSNYIMPSFDAMVNSGSGNLVFENSSDSRIYICASVYGGKARVSIYGVPNRYEIKFRSEIKETIPYKSQTKIDTKGEYTDRVVFDDESFVLHSGVDGIRSEGYLDYYEGEKLIFSRLYRKNTYAAIQEVIVKGAKKRPSPIEE